MGTKLLTPSIAPRHPGKSELRRLTGLVESLEKKQHNVPTTPFMHSLVYSTKLFGLFGKKKCPKAGEFFGKYLKDSVLIDVGAGGEESYLATAHFAYSCGVSRYVAVDRYVRYSIRDVVVAGEYIKAEENVDRLGMELHFVNGDMLLFLALQADSSVQVCMSAIDGTCIEKSAAGYIQELVHQISRVVESPGLAFGGNSPFLGELEQHNFQRIREIPGFGDISQVSDTYVFSQQM